MRIADKFTLSRIVLSPVFFLLYFLPAWTGFSPAVSVWILIPLLGFMEFTDFLDGFFARKLKAVSDFGKLFDPFADVILNLTVFFCALTSINSELYRYMPLPILVLILYREFSMTFLRMVSISKGVAIAARKGGKFKTVFYIASGFFMLACESALRLGFDLTSYFGIIKIISTVLFSICLVLSYVSFIDYIYKQFNGYYFEVYKCLKWEKIGGKDLEDLSFEIDDVHTYGFKTYEQAVIAGIDYIIKKEELWGINY